MARTTKKKLALTPEEKLEQALVPEAEQPYKIPANWCWTYLPALCEYMRAGGDKPQIMSDIKTLDCPIPVVANGLQNDGIIGYTNVGNEKPRTITVSGRGTIGHSVLRGYTYYPVIRLIVLAPNYSVLPEYLKYIFDYFEEEGTGTSIPQLTVPSLKTKAVPLPPLPEQHRIVTRIESLFAKLDEAREKAQAVADGFEDRKAAILHKAFTGELTEGWRKINRISSESWDSIKLVDECKVNPPKEDVKSLPDDLEVSFFPMPALSEIHGAITEPQTRPLGEVRKGFTNFSEGDVVFAKITPCMENGKSAVISKLVNGIGFGTTEFFVLRCSDRLYNRFLWHLVRDRYFRDEAKAVMTGAVGQQRVPKSFLENYPINLPSVEEQIEIVRILDDCFEKELQVKETAEQVLDQIDTMKKSILARAFRGELGTNDPEEESAVRLVKRVLEK